MPEYYAKSTTGNDANTGLTDWANAKAAVCGGTGASTIDVAGDTIYVSHLHAETYATNAGMTLAGTAALPVKVICANDSAAPPTAGAVTATFTTTGATNFSVTGSAYLFGLSFSAGTGANTGSILSGSGANTVVMYDQCTFLLPCTSASTATFGDISGTFTSDTTLKLAKFKFGGTTQRIKLGGAFRWNGGSIITGGTTPTSLFALSRNHGELVVNDVDFSNLSATVNMVLSATGATASLMRFNKCKMPESWSGGPWSASPPVPGQRVEMRNCYNSTTKFRSWLWDFCGQSRESLTIYRSAGSTDDAVPYSFKLASSADSEYPTLGFDGEAIHKYLDTTSAVTVNVEIVHDSQGAGTGAKLRNDEIGLKIYYPGGFVETVKADVVAAPVDHGTSVESWVTTGLTTPVKQVLTATFTPAAKGEVRIVPVLYAPSKTVYCCGLVG